MSHPRVIGGYDEDLVRLHLEEDPLAEDRTRVYIDHTGRWYDDVLTSELEKPDPLLDILREEIQKEVNRSILEKLTG